MKLVDVIGAGFGVAAVVFSLSCIAAWVTHVVWLVRILMDSAPATVGQIALGAIGAFMPPVGVIHGFVLWLL